MLGCLLATCVANKQSTEFLPRLIFNHDEPEFERGLLLNLPPTFHQYATLLLLSLCTSLYNLQNLCRVEILMKILICFPYKNGNL